MDLSARSFNLARPGVAPPLVLLPKNHKNDPLQKYRPNSSGVALAIRYRSQVYFSAGARPQKENWSACLYPTGHITFYCSQSICLLTQDQRRTTLTMTECQTGFKDRTENPRKQCSNFLYSSGFALALPGVPHACCSNKYVLWEWTSISNQVSLPRTVPPPQLSKVTLSCDGHCLYATTSLQQVSKQR